ncbi:hypothetical protein J4E91_007511 [Alternaria rosae]|nr:hypothetical protein J4E91_007511 [Alternaria rosae]
MDPRQDAEVVQEEAPPPYGYSYGHELPATPLHELSDRLMLAPELEGDHAFAELGGLEEQINDDSLDLEMSQALYSDLSESDERGAAAAPQPPLIAEATMLLWNLNTQYHFAPTPSMTSGRQSHKSSSSSSSPISPVTPNINGICTAQLHLNPDRTASIVSPLEGCPPSDIYWPSSIQMDTDWSNHSHASLPMLLVASPVESFRDDAHQQAKRFEVRQDDYPQSPTSFGLTNTESYIPVFPSPILSGHSLLELRSHRHDATGLRFGTYERSDDQGWQFCGGYERHTTKDKDIKRPESAADQPGSLEYADRFGGIQGPSTNYIELEDHQDPQFCDAPEQNEDDSALAHCDKCGKSFRGRYRKGNLRRHNIAFHGPLALAVRSTCRVCKRAYKRADATRKHEWKKHRMLDAMPKKRAK